LRPARLARSLILAARLGVREQSPQESGLGEPPAAPPVISRLCFAPGVDLAGMPTTIVSSVPAGITQLYLFFDYENMADGMIYELRVLRDGLSDPTFSLAPATWSGGERGLWYIGSTAQVWPNGNYEFIIFVEGKRAASATITIGGAAQPQPEMSTILFGVLSPENELVSTGNVLPVSNTINAQFVYNNMTPGLIWRQVWYYDSVPISEGAGEWTGGVNGALAINASSPPDQPLQPGRYRLELYIADRLAATSDFIMAGGQVGISTEIFSNVVFATERGADGAPAGTVGATQASGVPSLYALFDWRDVAPGTPITWRWSVDDNLLFETTQDWQGASTGSRAWLALQTQSGLADGSYRLDLLVAGIVEASATARVGLGALPVAVFAVEQGVRLEGQISDAETGEGILGATIIVLRPTFDVADFTWQMSEVFAMAATDLSGRFAMARPLPDDEFYSVIVIANGYLPTSTDSLEVADGRIDPITLNIALNRD
ncbi:MAG: carboxypeptidase regulatory-like domain-containing protein, partial [Anaerolineae bacterium]|nr:carboxypeptidase regulatory-like domain-containing protein [Anaerolineae bacterium]